MAGAPGLGCGPNEIQLRTGLAWHKDHASGLVGLAAFRTLNTQLP